eukprot:1155816-Pelagomonas_calceolata.AAC.3
MASTYAALFAAGLPAEQAAGVKACEEVQDRYVACWQGRKRQHSKWGDTRTKTASQKCGTLAREEPAARVYRLPLRLGCLQSEWGGKRIKNSTTEMWCASKGGYGMHERSFLCSWAA